LSEKKKYCIILNIWKIKLFNITYNIDRVWNVEDIKIPKFAFILLAAKRRAGK